MQNFTYHNPTKLVFGRGTIVQVRDLIPAGKRILMTCGGGSVKANGVYDQVKTDEESSWGNVNASVAGRCGRSSNCASNPRAARAHAPLFHGFDRRAETVFAREVQRGLQRLDAAAAGRIRQRGGRHAHGGFQALRQFPTFVQSQEHPGTEGIPRASGAGDELGGDV